MNVARPGGLPALLLTAAAASAAAAGLFGPVETAASASGGSSAKALRIRAPDLTTPLTERYPDPSRPADPVKAAVLTRINGDRAAFHLPPVSWDEAAARVGDAFCAKQVAEKSRGHFLMDGVPPYARTGFAGIFGVQAENSASWITTGPRFTESTVSLALEAEEQMLQEKPPADGHRRTILNPDLTHVGVGYAISRGRFQMSQEFLTRRFEQLTLAAPGPIPAAISISGRTAGGSRFDFVTIAREGAPRTLSRDEATARTSYSYPHAKLAWVAEGNRAFQIVGLLTEDRVRIHSPHEFSFTYVPDRPGLYTFVLYVSGTGREASKPGGGATVWVE
ncbi:MAG: CAP domain-containing protein [Acidobacteriota bacterium]